jgi:hypothetical protein
VAPLDFLFWAVVWLGTAAVTIVPDAASALAHRLGIGRGADLVIYLSLLLGFSLIFRLYVRLARLEHELTALVRALALEQLPEAIESSPSPHASASATACCEPCGAPSPRRTPGFGRVLDAGRYRHDGWAQPIPLGRRFATGCPEGAMSRPTGGRRCVAGRPSRIACACRCSPFCPQSRPAPSA